jgi:hypothetical protein
MKKLVCIMSLMLTVGCTAVQPWERANLAKQEMSLEPDGMQSAFKNHVYFSKEASSGGNSTAGGGCGCN